jgi:hypothetical protein
VPKRGERCKLRREGRASTGHIRGTVAVGRKNVTCTEDKHGKNRGNAAMNRNSGEGNKPGRKGEQTAGQGSKWEQRSKRVASKHKATIANKLQSLL